MDEKNGTTSRRDFIETVGMVGALGAVGALVAGCDDGSLGGAYAAYGWPPLLERAPDGRALRAGVIGCGGRGTGAAMDFLDAGAGLEVTALADLFPDRVQQCRDALREQRGVEVPEERCFSGFDGYHRLLATDVDLVILATPPYFRPAHFEAAVNARKHVFMEKPVAVDPAGCRSVMASARTADSLGLCVVTGHQRRHQADYVEAFRQVAGGAIGQVVAGNCYWNGRVPWWRDRQAGWSDMEYMLRDWVNWTWLSGDHLVEQHVHNLDVMRWFLGDAHPEKALGFGGRWRRPTGDQYDFFSIDFTFPGDVHVHSMCRQIAGCADNISEFVRGTKGYSNCVDRIWRTDGTEAWTYVYPLDGEGEEVRPRPFKQEHVDLVTAIRAGPVVNEAERTAVSTLTAIMGRVSCYTGQEVTWDQIMESDLRLGPDRLEFGPSELAWAGIPVPGTE